MPHPSDPAAPSKAPAAGEPENLGEFNGFEIYPMPAFVTLAVDDPAGVAGWYERALGFGVMFAGPVVHLRRRKYQDILLVPASPAHPASSGGPTLSYNADDGIDALASRAKDAAPLGRSAIEGPFDTPWNTRDLRVTDPAGHRLVFTARKLDADPESVDRWKAMFEAARKR